VVGKLPWANQSACRIPTPSWILLCLAIWTGPDCLSLSNRWSVGSLLFLLSWAVLMGPVIYARHLISGSRLPFTAAYFGSIALTLYFAIGVSLFLPFVRLDFDGSARRACIPPAYNAFTCRRDSRILLDNPSCNPPSIPLTIDIKKAQRMTSSCLYWRLMYSVIRKQPGIPNKPPDVWGQGGDVKPTSPPSSSNP
jgi:hypothetical protein